MFQKIFYEVRDNIDNKDFDPWKHFIYHQHSQVSKFATDLLSEKVVIPYKKHGNAEDYINEAK